MKSGFAILEMLLQPMLKRSLVLATNAILYVALVSHGNQQVGERIADLKAAEAKGISFDLRWWTPWPTARAHGINLPAVVPSYFIFYATGLMSNSDFIEPVPASGIVLVTASVFWWFFISFVGQQITAGAPSDSSRRFWTLMVGTIICSLVGLASLWGAMRQFDQVPPGHASEGLRYALESEYTLGKIFLLLWVSVGILVAAEPAAGSNRSRGGDSGYPG